jgi:predicted amino acid dehydrogenase
LGAELYKDQEPLSENILSSLKLAAKMGASTVSLTGLIPSATDYGRSIKQWINGHDNLPAITTGHATTTATIVKTITGILEQTDRDFADEKVAIVGLGSIGYATLRLMLEVMPHPIELILCDLYHKADSLEEIRNELLEKLGFNGSIRVVTTRGRIPDAIYDASFVLGASNVPGILDIKRIRPGTLLVDDSFPPCFRLSDAIRRIEEQQDILFTTGGLLRCSEEIKETIYLPDGAGELFASLGVDKVQRLAGRDPREITGCILSSLLTGHGPDIQTTIGPVEIEDSLAHYKLLDKLDLEAARPQCEGFFIDSEIIEKFKERDASSTTHAEIV